jgi:glycine/D-amino acid oxidase-like deaminating enzyme
MYSPNQDPPGLPKTPYTVGGGAPLTRPALQGDTHADIAVIGGGIAGCSVALHAAETGARVVLLEAKEIGWGASSRNSGHIPAATKQSPAEILQRYGRDFGSRLIAAVREGPELVFGLAEKHRMDASVVHSGNVVAAHTPAALEKLAARARDLQALGYPVEILDRKRTAEIIGSDEGYYVGCLFDHKGGTMNPLAYVRGLARAAIVAGAQVHEGSAVTRLARSGGAWRIETAQGSVTAGRVALCTNAYTDDLWPGLRQSIVPVRAYQYVTTPLRDNVRRTILPGGQGMTDTRRLMSGIRLFPDGRLFFSGQGPAFGPEGRAARGPSLRRINAIFPQLGELALDYLWTGWIAMNSEASWKIHEPAPGLLAALGCNGRGVAIATILGRELARYMTGTPAAELVMPFSPVKRIAVHAIHPPLVKALIAYYKVLDALEIRRHVGPTVRRPA